MSASHAPIADLVLLPCPYGNDPSTPTAYSRLSIQEPMARPDSARGLAVPERLPSAPHGLVVLPHGLVVLVGIPGWREVLWARKRHLFFKKDKTQPVLKLFDVFGALSASAGLPFCARLTVV